MRFLLITIAIVATCFILAFTVISEKETSWIRINHLGYQPNGVKVAIWCSKEILTVKTFELVESASNKIVFTAKAGNAFGAYGPFKQTHRLNFSSFKKPGKYFLRTGEIRSPEFSIDKTVYDGTADFCLRYMRQQRSGFNPFLKDSCHTNDGYTMYGPMSDSTHIDVSGGWHDASDYLQYATTSANATYHLLMAYRDFPNVFADQKLANGLDGKNRRADVLDEAKWGLDWLLKMHPQDDWMFNQIADDRDHIGFRIPKEDKQYGKGYERPVYFITGEPQGLFQYKNRTTGTSSTAAKFASAFALGSELFFNYSYLYADSLMGKAHTAFNYGLKKKGVTQTAPGRAPYFYEEDNWKDDMELALIQIFRSGNNFDNLNAKRKAAMHGGPELKPLLGASKKYAHEEPITPWLGTDTAKHYQWYPFINLGHYELAKQLKGKQRDTIIGYYKTGIQRVWNKAKQNAFYRGIPFIWCSNNLTTSFAIQCYWYKKLTGDQQFNELEQANFDWLFGCNPWGTSMVYGLPSHADTPIDPHSSFTKLKNFPIDGGLVDGPVYGSIYNNLKGITLYNGDEYAEFQSDLAVYHDDYGDYSTNEPTMDGTASLIYLLAAKEQEASVKKQRILKGDYTIDHGGIIRGDSTRKELAIVFTGDEFNDGGNFIQQTLQKPKIPASFFLTGNFYKNPDNEILLKKLVNDGHFVGNHSYGHLLYAPWTNRNKLLVNKDQFKEDLTGVDPYLRKLGVESNTKYFLPPYEWYNNSISSWTKELNRQLINHTPGTLSHADYTTPIDKNYRSSDDIYQSIINYETKSASGLNGFILLMHIGSDPKRTDKFYNRLPQLIEWMKKKGYKMVRVDELLD